LILEDDSVPEKIFYKNIQKYLKQLPKDFGLFFVSNGKNKFHIPLYLRKPFKKVYKKNNQPVSWGGAGASRNADAYFISKNCAQILYDEFNNENFTTDTSIDWWMNDMIRKHDISVYWAEPILIETNKYESSFK
jgi:GR25 family glycosyltransferase involved in LPS biosynthesis